MTALTTAIPTEGTATTSKFSLPPGWVNNEVQLMRRVEHLQAAIVDLSRNAMQVITWSEMIQEGIDEMQKSLPTLETEPEPDPDVEPDPDEEDPEQPTEVKG